MLPRRRLAIANVRYASLGHEKRRGGCRTKDIYFINIQPMHPTTMLRMVPRPSKGGHGVRVLYTYET